MSVFQDELKFCNFLLKWSAETIYQNERAIFYKRYNSINVRLGIDLQNECEGDSFQNPEHFLNHILVRLILSKILKIQNCFSVRYKILLRIRECYFIFREKQNAQKGNIHRRSS